MDFHAQHSFNVACFMLLGSRYTNANEVFHTIITQNSINAFSIGIRL